MEHASVESTKYKRSPWRFPTAKILKEALAIISRNAKLFSAIALLVFIPSSLLLLATQLAIKPQAYQILAKFTKESTDVSDYSRLLRHLTKSILLLLSEQLSLLALSWFLSVFLMVATIYASAATINYSGTKNDQYYYLSLKELLASIRRPGKRAAVTYLYVTLFNFGFTVVHVLTVIFMTMTISTQPSSFILTVLGANIIILSATALHMFLTAVWILSVAVSVLECDQEEGSGWYGMRALKKAWDLIRGRKLQAFCLSSLATLAMLPVSASLLWQMGNGTGVPLLILMVLLNGISVLLTLIVYVAFTIFYYDCKTTSEGDEKVIDLEGKPHYMSLIPAASPSAP